MAYQIKICQRCGAKFLPTTGNQKFCLECIPICRLARRRVSDKANAHRQERSRLRSQKRYAEHRLEDGARRRICYANNREYFIHEACVWAREHPEEKRIYSQKRRALKLSNTPPDEMLTIEEWVAILSKYRHHCAYCGCRLGEGEGEERPTVDHVIPLSQGGKHSKDNIVPACKHCNNAKYNRTPEQWIR
jgi:5-methylcytosine-specific restriction endonuclease McrA